MVYHKTKGRGGRERREVTDSLILPLVSPSSSMAQLVFIFAPGWSLVLRIVNGNWSFWVYSLTSCWLCDLGHFRFPARFSTDFEVPKPPIASFLQTTGVSLGTRQSRGTLRHRCHVAVGLEN